MKKSFITDRLLTVREASRGEEEKLFKENEDLKKEIQSLKMALTLAEIGNGGESCHGTGLS